ncbi:MAG: TonB family protein [Gammaproteobacteria bacterium]|nr:TonB family protein [Gammaproteobacteria bacterium]MDH4310655.1 TonB family protein [Gammaproteobacteria bacterium]MDH5273061.1 TonB family protein [Gammaproteobacteria bacterium]
MSATYFRVYDLPWTPSDDDQRRVRRVLGAVLGLFIGFGIVIPLLPDRPRTPAMAPAMPERIVEFILQQPKPKPLPKPVEVPPPEPVEVPKVEARVERPVPVTQSEPKPDPRKKAAASGLLALSDQLAELRDMDVNTNVDAKSLNAGAGERTRVDRSILTAKTGSGSGGIVVGEVSRGFGGGSTGLKGHATAKVSSAATEASAAPEAQRSGKSAKAARTREEIELVFDKNKSAIYSLYSRALRENPALQGKVVLEVTIAPSGEVTECRLISSELGDPELERKLVARVKMFRFEDRDVATMTTTKPIEFFPA